jgi:hypothetical protein
MIMNQRRVNMDMILTSLLSFVRRRSAAYVFAALFGMVTALPAFAVPGGPLPGTTVAAMPELAGVVIEDVIRPFHIPLAGGGRITGTLQDRVVSENTTGALDFYYSIKNGITSTGVGPLGTNIPDITEVIRRSFPPSVTTDMDWRIDGLGEIAPAKGSA